MRNHHLQGQARIMLGVALIEQFEHGRVHCQQSFAQVSLGKIAAAVLLAPLDQDRSWALSLI